MSFNEAFQEGRNFQPFVVVLAEDRFSKLAGHVTRVISPGIDGDDANRIAAGLELRLSQLLRLDEDGAVTVVRQSERRQGPAEIEGHSYEILTPPLPGQRAELSRHTLAPGAATGGPGDPPDAPVDAAIPRTEIAMGEHSVGKFAAQLQ